MLPRLPDPVLHPVRLTLLVTLLTPPLTCLAPAAALAQTDEHAAAEGPIRITPFAGAGVQIEYRAAVVHVAPWSRADYPRALPADLILVTDTPADHLDPQLIAALRGPTTTVIVPATPAEARDEGGAERLRAVAGASVMLNGERRTITIERQAALQIVVEAVPMYDLIPGEPFHAIDAFVELLRDEPIEVRVRGWYPPA